MEVEDKKPLIVYGTGDFAMIIYETALRAGMEVAGFTSDADEDPAMSAGLPPFVNRKKLFEVFPSEQYSIAIGFIGRGLQGLRSERFHEMKSLGYQIPNIVQPGARVEGSLGEGNLVLAGAVVGPRCAIGDGNILWQNCVLAHDNILGDFCNVGPNASFSGYARAGNHCFIGSNAALNNFIEVGDWAFVGACAYAAKNVPEKAVLVPARSTLLEGRKGADFA